MGAIAFIIFLGALFAMGAVAWVFVAILLILGLILSLIGDFIPAPFNDYVLMALFACMLFSVIRIFGKGGLVVAGVLIFFFGDSFFPETFYYEYITTGFDYAIVLAFIYGIYRFVKNDY